MLFFNKICILKIFINLAFIVTMKLFLFFLFNYIQFFCLFEVDHFKMQVNKYKKCAICILHIFAL